MRKMIFIKLKFQKARIIGMILHSFILTAIGLWQTRQIGVMVMVHTGSRALGHQVCSDSLRNIEKAMREYKINVPDRELACVPAYTSEAQNYLKQMACAANFGFCNRQLITHWIRESFKNIFKNICPTSTCATNQQYRELFIHEIFHTDRITSNTSAYIISTRAPLVLANDNV